MRRPSGKLSIRQAKPDEHRIEIDPSLSIFDMRLISILNQCYHFPGFVYVVARFIKHTKSVDIEVRERIGSKAICSMCHRPGPTYDHLDVRRFEFVPFWGFVVFLLYRMRRVDCTQCGVKVEAVPWGCGKHQMTTAYVVFLAHWAKKLSWKETALSFRTSWDKVCQAVEVVVGWGLEHRTLGPIQAIGVDEVAYGKGHVTTQVRKLHLGWLL